MDKSQIIKELEPIFFDILNKKISLNEETNASNIEEWDSLANFNILMEIERKYKISFNLNEIEKLKNIGEMANLILKKDIGFEIENR